MTSSRDRAILNSIFNPLLPVGECVFDEDIPNDLRDLEDDSPECAEAKIVEHEGVRAAESGKVDEAIVAFTKAIEMAPQRASGYNNRAQALRLKNKTNEALADLDKAIELSRGKGRAACQSYNQRAMIRRLQERDEDAKLDFQMAANLGSEFAKAQLVQMNPYAALCNKMLHNVIQKLQNGEGNGM